VLDTLPPSLYYELLVKVREMGFRVPPKAKAPLKVAGRLASFVDTWKVLTKDTWVLDAIQGYQIPFVGRPFQAQKPQEGVFSQEQAALIQGKWNPYYRREAILPCPNTPEGFYSTLFLPEEEWSDETNQQFETIQQAGRNTTLQNGGHAGIERPVENRRLDGEK